MDVSEFVRSPVLAATLVLLQNKNMRAIYLHCYPVVVATYYNYLSECSIKSAETRRNKNFLQKLLKM